VTTADLGIDGGVNKGDLNGGRITTGAFIEGSVAINGVDIGAVITPGGADEMERVINLETASTGVVADAYNVVEGTSTTADDGITNGLQITVGSSDTVTLGATSSMANLAETINRDVEGLTATVGGDGNIILNNDSGETITIAGTVTGSGLEANTFTGYLGLTSQSGEPISVDEGSAAVTGTNDNTDFGFMVSNGSAVLASAAPTGAVDETNAITINGIAFETTETAIDDIVTDINKLTDDTGVTATNSGGVLLFTAENGGDIVIASGEAVLADRISALAKLGINDVGGTSVDDLALSVTTSANAVRSLDRIDEALDKISSSRANLGAIQNRLSSTISNLENVSQNLSASNSRIQDADFAAETSKMSKAQILQQAGTSMLSQANASTQNVLSLLQG
jgi:flagellin